MQPSENQPQAAPPDRAKFNFGRFAIWFALSAGTAWLLAIWPAAQISKYFSPLVLFPLLEGLVLGGITLFWLHTCNQGHRRSTLAGSVLIVLVFVITQHDASFRAVHAAAIERQNAISERQTGQNGKLAFAAAAAELAPAPADNLWQYLQEEAKKGRPLFGNVVARGSWAWASWAFDGFLVLVLAFVMVVPALNQPYCNACHTWYKVVRTSPIPGDCEKSLRSACGLADESHQRANRATLLACSGGCGPGALDLTRETSSRGPAPRKTRLWLTVPQRQAVTAILDQQTPRKGTES